MTPNAIMQPANTKLVKIEANAGDRVAIAVKAAITVILNLLRTI